MLRSPEMPKGAEEDVATPNDRKHRAKIVHAAHFSAASVARPNSASANMPFTPKPRVPSSLRESMAVAAECRMTGEGIETAIVRQLASFTITAVDASGEALKHGGDSFKVDMRGSGSIRARTFDNEDGTYTVRYFPNTSGKYHISVTLNGMSLPQSPCTVHVLAARPDPLKCQLRGDALQSAIAREPSSFEVSFLDGLGQYTHAEDLDVFVELLDRADDGVDALERLRTETQAVVARQIRSQERQERQRAAQRAAEEALAAPDAKPSEPAAKGSQAPPQTSPAVQGGSEPKSGTGRDRRASSVGASSSSVPAVATEIEGKSLPADEEPEPLSDDEDGRGHSDGVGTEPHAVEDQVSACHVHATP